MKIKSEIDEYGVSLCLNGRLCDECGSDAQIIGKFATSNKEMALCSTCLKWVINSLDRALHVAKYGEMFQKQKAKVGESTYWAQPEYDGVVQENPWP